MLVCIIADDFFAAEIFLLCVGQVELRHALNVGEGSLSERLRKTLGCIFDALLSMF